MKNTGLLSTVFVRETSIGDHHLQLIASLPYSETGTRRLCFHESNQSDLHVMLVQASPDQTFPRHCHADSDEFTTVLSGGLEISIWSDGLQSQPHVLVLGPDFSGQYAALVPRGVAHTTRPLSEATVYLEVKLGPFNPDALLRI